MSPISKTAPADRTLTREQVADVIAEASPAKDYRDKKILLIVPDGTRTAPVGLLFQTLYRHIGEVTKAFDVLIALGTHQPMSESAICRRLEISEAERGESYRRVRFFNHAWNNPAALKRIGVIPAEEIRQLSNGRFAMDVPVDVNRMVFDYDQIIILGPVFPHEVVGFSGGNKYLFPGVAGPEILNFFHWLGAVITTPKIIGNKWTPVRRVVDRAASMVEVPKLCFCMVVDGGRAGVPPAAGPSRPAMLPGQDTPTGTRGGRTTAEELAGLFAGTPESAWDGASDLSRQRHIVYREQPFHTILSCAPKMYDEVWTGGKAMYKLEPVLADGGELIIYAPHISQVCVAHGKVIEEVGYHCRDYFLKQWEQFKNYPWGVLAHCAHVYGLGTFENGVETPRARVTLATQIPPETCRRINLGYRDPKSIRIEDFTDRESDGILLVPKAGETLFRLKNPPDWAKESL